MELVYLWVEEYKNIHQQGFNFSGRFKCDFDGENLTIEENKDYVHIFPENVNVTAIVGENGSGKSRVLNCIEKIILANNGDEFDEFNYILVYQKEETFYISNMAIKTFIEKETVISDVCSLVYKYYVSYEKINQARYYSSANLHYVTLQKQEIVNILSAKQDNLHSFHISSFMYEPVKVEISLKSYKKLVEEYIFFIDFKKRDEIREILNAITDLYYRYLSILYIRQKGLDVDSGILKNKELLIQNTSTSLSQDNFNTFFTAVTSMKEYEISKISQEQKNIYFHRDYWHYFEFDFIDEKDRRYNHLSHGEKVIFSQLLSIFFYMNKNEKLLFLFDEPEIALHPNWQKKYLKEVIDLLQKIPKNYHFIFATHSPFLLSDLLQESIIFLKKDDNDNCQIKNGVYINPFGANIHTLLSHGFFMEDGLMGEFAKSKINEIIEFHNRTKADNIDKNALICEYDKHKTQFWHIQNSIGEEYLKQVIKNHLIEIEKILLGKDEAKNAEIARVEAYLKSLKND